MSKRDNNKKKFLSKFKLNDKVKSKNYKIVSKILIYVNLIVKPENFEKNFIEKDF